MRDFKIPDKAWKLLSAPGRWIKGYMAINKFNVPTLPSSDFAVCWCVLGAVCAVYYSKKDPEETELIDALKTLENYGIDGNWNDADCRTHEDVVALLKELDL